MTVDAKIREVLCTILRKIEIVSPPGSGHRQLQWATLPHVDQDIIVGLLELRVYADAPAIRFVDDGIAAPREDELSRGPADQQHSDAQEIDVANDRIAELEDELVNIRVAARPVLFVGPDGYTDHQANTLKAALGMLSPECGEYADSTEDDPT